MNRIKSARLHELPDETFLIIYVLHDSRIDWSDKLTYTRRTMSPFWSFKIRRTTFLNCIKFADSRILRL